VRREGVRNATVEVDVRVNYGTGALCSDLVEGDRGDPGEQTAASRHRIDVVEPRTCLLRVLLCLGRASSEEKLNRVNEGF
jgi:hypothetical protein